MRKYQILTYCEEVNKINVYNHVFTQLNFNSTFTRKSRNDKNGLCVSSVYSLPITP